MPHLNYRKVGFLSQLQGKHTSPRGKPAHGAVENQLMEQYPAVHISAHFSKERVCDKAEDLALVVSQVERMRKGNIIYHLQNNLQPLILQKCF